MKPRLVRPAAARLARRGTPEPFSTSTLTLAGLVVSTWAVALGVAETFGTVMARAMAANTSLACGCMSWMRLALGVQVSYGAVMNYTFWPDRSRKLCPMWPRSVADMP